MPTPFACRALEAQPEARLAVQVALAGLRLHGWWDSVEPRLPRSWAWLWQGLYTLSGALCRSAEPYCATAGGVSLVG